MKRESTGSRNLVPQSRTSREVTLQELLDRDSREKTVGSRKPRENTVPEIRPETRKEPIDKNMRINNLQKEFEELKSKIKHVQNKNERILTKLKSYKDDSREKSRGRANNSIQKDQFSEASNPHSVTHSVGPHPPGLLHTASFGRNERPVPESFLTQYAKKEDRPTQDAFYPKYPRKESLNSSYGVVMEENAALKQLVDFLKLQVEKHERTLASRSQIYDSKEQYYKDMVESKDQEIQRLKEPRNRQDMRKLVEWLNTTERANADVRYNLERRVKDLDDRLGRTLKLLKLCERTIKEQRANRSQRKAAPPNKADVEFFNLKEKQLESIIDQLEKDQRRLRNQINEATQEAEESRQRMETLKDSHEEELRELRNKYTTRMSAVEKKYTDELKHTADDIAQLKRERDDAVEQLTDEKLLLTKVRRELAEAEERVKKADARFAVQIEDAQHQIAQLKERLNVLLQERDGLQSQLDRTRMGRSMKDSDLLSSDRNEAQELDREVRALKLDVERKELEIAQLKRDNWQLGLKLKKKEEFKVELEEVYRDKLQEETRGATLAREEKRKAELELSQLRSQLTCGTAQQQRIQQDLLQEVQLLAQLEGQQNPYGPLLELYKDDPAELPLEVIRLVADNKRVEMEDRERILKLVESRKLQFVGYKRVEVQVVEQLIQMLSGAATELRLRDQAAQQAETRSRWEKELLEQQVSKLKKSNEQLKRQREKDDLERKQRKSEVAQARESIEEEQKERYAELRTIILKAETDKKQLEKRLKMMQFEADEQKETFEEQTRRRDRTDADRERQIEEFQQRQLEKEERLRQLQGEVRDLKEEAMKRKRQYTTELRKTEYDLNEKISRIEQELEEKESQLQFKDEQLAALSIEVASLNGNLTAQKAKLSKELTDTEKSLRESLTKKEEEVRTKAVELTQMSAAHHELVRRLAQLEHQTKQREGQDQLLRQTSERQREKLLALEKLRQSQRAEFEQKLKLKKENEQLLAKRLDLKAGEALRNQQEVKQLRQRLEESHDLRQEHERLQDNLILKESQLIELEQKVRALDEQRKQAAEKHTEESQANTLKTLRLEGHIKNIEQQLGSREGELEKLKGNLHQKQTELAKVCRELEASQQQLKDKDGQLQQLRSLHDKAIGSNEGLKKQAEQYSAMLAATEQKQTEINELRKQMEELIGSNSELEQKLRAATEATNKLQLKSQKKEQQLLATMEQERLSFEQRIQEQKKQLEREAGKLQQTLALAAEKESLVEQQARTELQLKSKISSLQDSLRKTNLDFSLSLTQHKQSQDQRLEALKKELKKLTDANRDAEQTIRQLKSQLQTQVSRVPSMKSLKSLKNIRGQRLPTQDDEMLNLEQGLTKIDPESANFFSIGEDEPVKKKDPAVLSEIQLKEFFDRIRIQLEKVLNDDEISVEVFEVLPGELADDFQELVTAVRNRIMELNERIAAQELSFVYLDQQEEANFGDSFIEDFPEMAPNADPQEVLELRGRLSEQQRQIQNLTSEKEQHEQTVSKSIMQINQLTQEKEEAEEENEARFITQLGVLKKELKEMKERIESLDSLLTVTKKTLFRVLEVLLPEKEGSSKKIDEDLADTLNGYMAVAKLQEREKQLLLAHFQRQVERSKSASKKSWFG